jgi:hypothetical protein
VFRQILTAQYFRNPSLTGVYMICSAVEGFLAPLQPAAQALHHPEFVAAIDRTANAFKMVKAWAK